MRSQWQFVCAQCVDLTDPALECRYFYDAVKGEPRRDSRDPRFGRVCLFTDKTPATEEQRILVPTTRCECLMCFTSNMTTCIRCTVSHHYYVVPHLRVVCFASSYGFFFSQLECGTVYKRGECRLWLEGWSKEGATQKGNELFASQNCYTERPLY